MPNFLDAAGSLWTKSFARLEYSFLNNSEIVKGSNFKSSSTFRQTSVQSNLFSGRPRCFPKVSEDLARFPLFFPQGLLSSFF